MTNFIEIGGLIKKGLGNSVVERFSKNIDVVSIGYANGRSSDLFDIQQFGDASEAEILTIIVKGRKSNAIFDELYSGTNPDEATKAGIAFLKYLENYKHVDFILTTHYLNVCKNFSNSKHTTNYKMDVSVNEASL